MSKKSQKHLDVETGIESHYEYREELKSKPKRLVLFTKRVVLTVPYGNTGHSSYRVFAAGQYTLDEETIEELLKRNEKIEIYERVE